MSAMERNIIKPHKYDNGVKIDSWQGMKGKSLRGKRSICKGQEVAITGHDGIVFAKISAMKKDGGNTFGRN